jgi:hypothetical protein
LAEDQAAAMSKATTDDLRARYREAVTKLAEHDKSIATALGLAQGIKQTRPVVIKSDKTRGESVAVAVFSDWHLEETVKPSTVSGRNEYNLPIAQRRIRSLWPNTLKVVEMCRHSGDINTLVVALIGDFISGGIHEDLVESNSLSPTQATLEAFKLIVEGLDFFLKEGGFKRIIVTCKYGNHGRDTIKPRISTAAIHSYEYLMFQLLMHHYDLLGEKRLVWDMVDGYFNYVQIYGFTYRFHHGDGLKFAGGVGGVLIPLNKAIAQYNKLKHADCDVLGHWHERQCGSNFVINGSVVGYNAYSVKIKASFQPPQQSFFLVHPTWGRTVECPLFVEGKP